MAVKFNLQQQHAIAQLEIIADDMATAKRALRKQIEEEFEARYDELRRRRSRLANEALAVGVSKTRIGRAIGTSDWATVNETLALTAEDSTTMIRTPQPICTWEYDPDTMVLLLHEYRNRAGETVTADLVVDGEMRDMADGYRVRPTYVPDEIALDYLNQIYMEVAIQEGMIKPAEPEPEVESEPDEDIAAQIWANEYVEDKDEW